MSLRSEFLNVYLTHHRGLLPNTRRAYDCGLRRIELFCSKPVDEITAEDAWYYLGCADLPGTKAQTLAALKHFHRFVCLKTGRSPNGIMLLQAPRMPAANARPALSMAQARQLLGACMTRRELRAIYLGLYAGTRIEETSAVSDWSDRLTICGKGGKVREVPVHRRLDAVKQILLSEQAPYHTIRYAAEKLSERTGIEFTTHALRRTFGVTLSEAGADRDVVGSLLGHGPRSVTVEAYVPIRWSEKLEAIALLDYSA